MASKFDGDDRVKVVELTRGDKFYFSRKYAEDETLSSALDKHWNDLDYINSREVVPRAMKRLDTMQKLGLWGTAALEGSPVEPEEAVRILSGEKTDVDELSRLELLNIREAYSDLESLCESGNQLLIDEDLIKEKHAVLTAGLGMKRNEPGVYRNLENYQDIRSFEVGSKDTGGVFHPPRLHKDIVLLMKEFCAWINSEEMLDENPLVRAALAHYHLAMIHPFWDGNGRLVRLIEAMILASSGVRYTPRSILKYYYDEYSKYYKVFRLCEKQNEKAVSLFIWHVLNAHTSAQIDALKEINSNLKREVATTWAYRLMKNNTINKRQHKLILLLIDKQDDVSIKILKNEFPYSMVFEKVSEDTIRRDVKGLEYFDILRKDGLFYSFNQSFWKSPQVVKKIVG